MVDHGRRPREAKREGAGAGVTFPKVARRLPAPKSLHKLHTHEATRTTPIIGVEKELPSIRTLRRGGRWGDCRTRIEGQVVARESLDEQRESFGS